MKKVAVVIGTCHKIQRGEELKDSFEPYLIDLCKKHKISAIAEEIRDDEDFVVAVKVCQDLAIGHTIIEPNPTQYSQLGIEQYHVIEYEIMTKYNLGSVPSAINNIPPEALSEFKSRIRNEHSQPREIEWLKRIQEYDYWPILVICGSSHFQPFCDLLSENDISVINSEIKLG